MLVYTTYKMRANTRINNNHIACLIVAKLRVLLGFCNQCLDRFLWKLTLFAFLYGSLLIGAAK